MTAEPAPLQYPQKQNNGNSIFIAQWKWDDEEDAGIDLVHLCVLSPQDFSYDDPKLEFNVDAPNGVVMEGYLFKRASNAFKTWNR